MIGELAGHVHELRLVLDRTRYGDVNQAPLAAQFNGFVYQADSLLTSLASVLSAHGGDIAGVLDTLSASLVRLSRFARSLRQELPRLRERIDSFTDAGSAVLDSVKRMTVVARGPLDAVAHADSLPLLVQLDLLAGKIRELQAAVTELRRFGFPLQTLIVGDPRAADSAKKR
jgi:hypothetical protein